MPLLGPVVGPLIGGFVVLKQNWRWTQWTILMWTVFAYIPALLMKETLKKVILRRRARHGSITTISNAARFMAALKESMSVTYIRPLQMLLAEPVVLAFSIHQFFIIAFFYTLNAAIPFAFLVAYRFDADLQGLVYLGFGIAFFLGLITALLVGILKMHKIRAAAAAGIRTKPPPEARLQLPRVAGVVPPADNFHFSNGDLFVEASGANRHRHATAAELRDLFHPPQNSSIPVRDPPAHWYEAQLIHYGLPPSKVKGTAVKRLLDAVNSGTLSVPPLPLDLERSLKKQWDENERKAKKDTANVSATSRPSNQGTKRKAAEIADRSSVGVNGMNFNFQFNMGNMGMYTVEPAPASTPKSARKVQSVTKLRQQEEQAPPRQPSALPILEHERVPYGGPPLPGVGSSVGAKARTESKVKAGPKARPEPKIKAEPMAKPAPNVNAKPKVKSERPAPSTPRKIKAEPETRNGRLPPSPSPATTSLDLINGFYPVSCPEVTDQWGCQDLSIIVCFDTQHVWCAYDFEIFSGIFLLDRRPVRASDEQIPVRWRGRENGEGEMTTGDDNYGWISFLGGGCIEGSLEIMGEPRVSGIQGRGRWAYAWCSKHER